MSDTTNVQKNKLTPEQKKLINASLSTNIIRFQEYRLNSNKDPDINPGTGQPKKKDSLKPDGAIFFEYLCYNSFKLYVEEQTSNGYFYHSYERIEDEYGIGKDRVQKITAYLKNLGIVETKVCGFPPNTYYRIRFDNLAKVDVLINLFSTTPARTKQIARHYGEIAKIVNLKEETTQETLSKQYPVESRWFKDLKAIFYQERRRFNNTLALEFASKKVQPMPREETYRRISMYTQSIHFDLDGTKHAESEQVGSGESLMNGFRLYCAIFFFFDSKDKTNSQALRQLVEENQVCADDLVNSLPRDPIAYFFAQQEGGTNYMMTDMIEAAQTVDFSAGYFSN